MTCPDGMRTSSFAMTKPRTVNIDLSGTRRGPGFSRILQCPVELSVTSSPKMTWVVEIKCQLAAHRSATDTKQVQKGIAMSWLRFWTVVVRGRGA